MINSIHNLSQPAQTATGADSVNKAAAGFGDLLSSMVNQVNETQMSGDRAIENLQNGTAQHLHEVMIAVEQADISLRMAVQLRNKALTAYEEIMRMQI
jgi:flagellar hook-basal body complex protein FliE